MSFVPAPQALVGSKYRLLGPLGAGGMGTVWLASHETLGVEVAVKFMLALLDGTMATARFEREAKASAQLKSPHVVEVHDYGVEDGTPFMVMERLVGEDLGARIAERGRLTLDETARVTTQLAKALSVAHAAGIVHRDLKPSNVFLAREGGEEIVKLLDFGIMRELGALSPGDDRTLSGMIVGSAHHMSPEQAQAQPVDHRSDLWSLGVVVYRALTGRRPFEGDSVTAVMLAVVSKPYPLATEVCRDLPRAIDRFFERALARDVRDRFPDATTMAVALATIAGGGEMAAWSTTAESSARRGRDEPTLDDQVAAPRTIPRESDLRGPSANRNRTLRAGPWIVLAVAASAASFWLGHGRRTVDPKLAAAPPSTPYAVSVVRAAASPASPDPISPPSASSAPSPTPSSTVPTASVVRATHHPRPKPKVDPFTGLPLSQ